MSVKTAFKNGYNTGYRTAIQENKGDNNIMTDNMTQGEKDVEQIMQMLREHPELLAPTKLLTEKLLARQETLSTGQDLLTIPELEKILRTTRRTIYKWIDSGEIKAFKVGRSWRVDMEDLKAFIQSRVSNKKK